MIFVLHLHAICFSGGDIYCVQVSTIWFLKSYFSNQH